MTLREAFKDVEFRKGTWVVYFNENDSVGFCAESFEDLEWLWNDFVEGDGCSLDSVDYVEEGFDPYYGNWIGERDKESVKDHLEYMLRDDKLGLHENLKFALKAAMALIDKATVEGEFWVDGYGD